MNSFYPLPFPLKRLCRIEEKGPSFLAKPVPAGSKRGAGIQVLILFNFFKMLDARFRWHDELRRSLQGGEFGRAGPHPIMKETHKAAGKEIK
jgi:hypothetical protein